MDRNNKTQSFSDLIQEKNCLSSLECFVREQFIVNLQRCETRSDSEPWKVTTSCNQEVRP